MNTRKTIIEKIATTLETLDDETLLEEYVAIRTRRPSEPPPPTVSAAEPRDLSTRPGSTLAIVYRVLERAGRPMLVRDIVTAVHAENRAIKRDSVRGALSRLVAAGRVERKGPHRSGTYRLHL